MQRMKIQYFAAQGRSLKSVQKQPQKNPKPKNTQNHPNPHEVLSLQTGMMYMLRICNIFNHPRKIKTFSTASGSLTSRSSSLLRNRNSKFVLSLPTGKNPKKIHIFLNKIYLLISLLYTIPNPEQWHFYLQHPPTLGISQATNCREARLCHKPWEEVLSHSM